MARVIAPMALAALELSGDPVHEPVHARGPCANHPATVRNFTLESASVHATSRASVMRAILTGRPGIRMGPPAMLAHYERLTSPLHAIIGASSSPAAQSPGPDNVKDELDAAIAEAVKSLRGHGYSWAEIGSGLGVTRQACPATLGNIVTVVPAVRHMPAASRRA